MSSSRKVLLVALVALGLSACAEERGPINRVQPNALQKKMFIGESFQETTDDPEFWFQGTIVDVGYGAAQDGLFTSTYGQPVSRVKFVVQENLLVARLAYERISGSDLKGVGPASTNGIVVAAYPISSHFDIKRDYNSSTGEEINVINENTSDRPWYEREYMRVDWSKNMNVDAYDFDTLSQVGIYGGVKYEPLAYYVNDPTDPDAPHFADTQDYFDVTTKAFAQPQMIDLSHLGWGLDKFPSCWLDPDFMNGTGPSANCNPVELTIRQSFRKVVDNDYEPEHWDGLKFQAYGAFTADRKGYSRRHGMTDDLWYRFIARYNLWERSHAYADLEKMVGAVECNTGNTRGLSANRDESTPVLDENGKPVYDEVDGKPVLRTAPGADGTDDECAEVAFKFSLHQGSRCDTFTQKCTLPYRDRQTAPVLWYVSTGSDFRHYEGTEWATQDWDVALRHAVQAARYTECMRTKDEAPEKCAENYPMLEGQIDDQHDAIALGREVDDCRNGRAYKGQDCDVLADELGERRGYSDGVVSLAKQPEMVVLCHSPVEANDPELCGGPRLPANMTAQGCSDAIQNVDKATIATCNQALNARLGDLRYHQVNIIPTPQTPSPWGIMVDSVDPLSGEKIAASINVWSYVTDIWSQGVIDVSRHIKGEISTDEVTEGEFVRDWNSAARAASSGASYQMAASDVRERVSSFTGVDAARLADSPSAKKVQAPAMKVQMSKLEKKIKGLRFDASAPSTTRATYNARRQRAVGSAVEAQLVTKPMQQLAGMGSGADAETMMKFASPLRGANPTMAREFRRMRDQALAARGVCMMEAAPPPVATAALADVLERKFGAFNKDDDLGEQFKRAERMRGYLAQKAQHSVIVHEMGHSVGLRHNFVSSSDAFNYRPQYWQLRTRNGQIKNACTDLRTGAKDCVGPRYFDAVTQEESENLIWMFMHSSTMDYAGEGTQDMLGLGAWDFAATRMFYGNSVAVQADPTFKVEAVANDKQVVFDDGQTSNTLIRSRGLLAKMDNFGGIVGLRPSVGNPNDADDLWASDLHYSQLQNAYDLISDCKQVSDPEVFKPANWNEDELGTWDALLDGLIVKVGGYHSRCRQQKVDYVSWDQLKMPGEEEMPSSEYYAGGPSIDPVGRVRVPYGFATDNWADLGNLSVYRHDNGADAYELFDFFISQQEVNHIFDNYRRNRHTFSLRGAAGRALGRYNEKMRDGAKGLGLMANIYREFAVDVGLTYDEFWAVIAQNNYKDNILASTIAFDYFANQLSRPQAGSHYLKDGVLRSAEDAMAGGDTVMNIFNGATGLESDVIGVDGGAKYRNLAFGGRPLENRLCEGCGEYDSEYTMNCGSYYEKLYTSMLMTESVDNFISDSRGDFLDGRYRAVSLADLFPEGYRRWLANNLTLDDEIKGQRVAAVVNPVDNSLSPVVESGMMWPSKGLARISWAGATPVVCFPSTVNIGGPGAKHQSCVGESVPTLPVDPQVGWEQIKFLINWTMLYLPENQQRNWLDMMHIWEKGVDSDPGFANRIEFHHPSGRTYIAKTYGKETIFGKVVQKGIAARVLEYANSMLKDAYDVDDGPDLDNDGVADWYVPRLGAQGVPNVKYDSGLETVDSNWYVVQKPGCTATDNSKCTCADNRACVSLGRYVEVPYFMRQTMAAYGLADPDQRGVY